MSPLRFFASAVMEPPPGVMAHPRDQSPIPADLIATATVSMFLTTSAICARMFTKAYDLKRVQLEDYAVVFAGLGYIAFCGVLFYAASAGQGQHVWNVSQWALKRVALLSNILGITYAPVMFSAKFAVLLQIGRIFAGIQRNFVYWAVRAFIAFNALSYAGIFFARIFACMPRSKIMDPKVPGHCISQNGAFIATGAINAASDVMILLLPLYGVSRLHLPTKRKFSVAAIFSVGFFACVSSAFRLYYSVKLQESPDFTKAIWPVNMWALAEFTCVILVACFPTFPRLLQYFQGKTKPRTVHAKWHSKPSNNTSSHSSSRSRILCEPAIPPADFKAPSSEDKHVSLLPLEEIPLPSRPASVAESTVSPLEERLHHTFPAHVEQVGKEDTLVSEASQLSVTTSATSIIEEPPTSNTMSDTSELRHATRMSVTPVRYASIRKTVDVRVSNHTNPGSPMVYNNPTFDR